MFLIFVIFLFFTSFANALVVQDISQQIEQGNTKLIENSAVIESNVSQMKEQITALTTTIQELQANSLTKEDMSIIRQNIDYSMAIWQQQLLIMFLVLIFFTFAVGIYGRSKRWF